MRSRPNGSIIGSYNPTSQASAGGIRTILEATTAISANVWPIEFYTINYLVVAGGGGGGYNGGGGGGAGGAILGSSTVLRGQSYTIVIGAGGPLNVETTPVTGNNSSISGPSISATALGGGGGSSRDSGGPAASGGSGGGAGAGTLYQGYQLANGGANGTPGQGNAGGNSTNYPNTDYQLQSSGGGGGGAGSAGGAGNFNLGGTGGTGILTSITGTATYFAGGGGGGTPDYFTSINTNASAGGPGGLGGGGNGAGGNAPYAPYPGVGPTFYNTAGNVNTGGGGGGAGGGGGTNNGGAGGSGIVILSIPTGAYTGAYTGSNVKVQTDGFGNTVVIFYSSGTYKT